MKLLLALDGSDCSVVARDLVATLALPPASEIHLLAAYAVPADWAPDLGTGMAWIDDAETQTQESLEEMLRSLGTPFVAAGHEVVHHIVRGRAATAITDTAADLGVDLIVTGSRGRGALASALLGSTAAEVTAHAPCPVLVARHPAVQRLLVATDGSANANRIPDRFAAWGCFSGLPADVLAVSIPSSPTFELVVGLYTLGDERLAAKREQLRNRSHSDAEALASRLTEVGIPATPHVRGGDPAHEIVEAAHDHGADLVVTGSRGLTGLDRILLGSVARNVLTHARTSVLVMREATVEAAVA